MAITQKLLNLDAFFRSTHGDKIIVNDLNYFSVNDIEKLNKNLMTIYNNTDVISVKPSCDCGKTSGRYLIGKTCPHCGTNCMEPHEKVMPLLWLRTIDEENLFVNPIIWLMMKKLLSNRIDCMRYLCDVKYNPPIDIPSYVLNIRDQILNGERVYSKTIRHLKEILTYLLGISKFKINNKQEEIILLLKLLEEHKDEVYSHYLPIVNKKLFVIENTTKGKYVNLTSSDIVDVVMNWIKLCSEDVNLTPKQISSTIAVVMSSLTSLYNDYFKDVIIGKPGMFRKHVYGTRSHFTFRCVIVSRPGEHAYDEVIVPWTIGVVVFRPHLLNKLTKLGYNYKDANKLLFKACKCWDPVISKLLDELIKESPHRGIPITALRNPSLLIGSVMLLYIVGFKQDPKDYGMEISQLIIKNANGDYDGDELNICVLLDNMMHGEALRMQPHYSIPDTGKPYGVSGLLTLLSPSTSILSNYIHDEESDNTVDTCIGKLNFMEVETK